MVEMAIETDNPTTKEVVLTQLTFFWRNNDGHGLNDQEELEFERIYGLLTELNASRYEVLKAEFLAEPENDRQNWLNSEAKSFNPAITMDSLESAEEYLGALHQIRDEFSLEDPYLPKQRKAS